jgi:hypothetical protein
LVQHQQLPLSFLQGEREMNSTEWKIVLTYNSWTGYAKITVLDSGDKEELLKHYQNEPLYFSGRTFGLPTNVRFYRK